MKRHLQTLLILLAILTPSTQAREIIPLNTSWKFLQKSIPGAESPSFNDASWQEIQIPHDWSIAGPFSENAPTRGSGGWLPSGVAFYRKSIDLPKSLAGNSLWLEFDGVMANSEVWFNGKSLGTRPNGYVSFRYDVSHLIQPDSSQSLVVKTDTSAQPASRWYSGAGIYRNVRLVAANPLHISPWGVFATTEQSSTESATLRISTQITNRRTSPANAVLRTILLNSTSQPLAQTETVLNPPPHPSPSLETSQSLQIPHPPLWSVESPTLLTLVSQIIENNTVTDEVRTPIGIRTAEFRSNTGFWLNGKNFKLKGVCIHHDGGAVGAAVPTHIWERRLSTLKHLGVNAIRTAHNPPSPEFLDLCDRMGFLVMDEFFDCWLKSKNPHDFHKFFKQWAHTDLRDSILRDRNHPSIILYSVGNEIHDTTKPDVAKPILRGLVDICHATDPSRPVTQALFRPNVSGDYHNGLADMLDVIGTNYRDQELLQAWKDQPTRKIIGTEQAHERSTWLACRDNPPHAGQFLWVGIDYLGESRRWPLTVFNAGLIDRCGFIQPRGWERQSWWSEKPMVKALRRVAPTAKTPSDPGYEANEWLRQQVLFDDWTPDDPSSQTQTVEVYSNADDVELFLNGKSQGKQSTHKDARALNWKIPFENGELLALASNSGKEVARDSLRTAGKPATILLLADRPAIGTRWDEVAHVEVRIVDSNGVIVPNANHLIQFQTSTNTEWLAADSGDVYNIEPFQSQSRKAFQGRSLAIVRAKAPGPIVVKASVEGLPTATLEILATP